MYQTELISASWIDNLYARGMMKEYPETIRIYTMTVGPTFHLYYDQKTEPTLDGSKEKFERGLPAKKNIALTSGVRAASFMLVLH